MSTEHRAISVWRLAAQQALRDFRAGELRLVLVAVMLAVAALSAVGFFADRLQGGLTRDAAQLLGGDTVISSDHPLPAEFEAQAQAGWPLPARRSSPAWRVRRTTAAVPAAWWR